MKNMVVPRAHKNGQLEKLREIRNRLELTTNNESSNTY